MASNRLLSRIDGFLEFVNGLVVLLELLEGDAVEIIAFSAVFVRTHAFTEDLGRFLVRVPVEIELPEGDKRFVHARVQFDGLA